MVIHFSDNGPNSERWNGAMKGRKGTTDEGGVRSPLFVRWPGHIPRGTRVKEIAGAIDLLPTLAAMADVRHIGTKPLDGRDLSPLLTGKTTDWPGRMIFSTWGGKVSARSQRYRLDNAGELYDMEADPSQKKNIAAQEPAVASKMAAALAAWKKEMGLTAMSILPTDDRPYPVGYPEFPTTPLPARDGVAEGGIKRSANAPNSSYFVNWKSLDGRITWDVDVHTTGEYDAVIYYTAPLADAGATIELSLNGAKLTGKVQPGWDPPLYTNQDTIPRPAGESQMKEFRPLKLGTIQLEKGRGPLTLRALEMPGQSVMDVRAIYLTLRK